MMLKFGRFSLLRRVGGLRRLLFGILGLLLAAYFVQTFILSSKNDPASKEVKVESTVSKAPDIPPTKQPELKNDQKVENQAVGTRQICGVDTVCKVGELVFNLSGILGETQKPQACINDLLIFDNDKLSKGLNIVIMDENKKAVQDIKYFDLLTSDRDFVGFMSEILGQRLIFLSSWGDVADRLSSDSREILQKFGSAKVSDFKRGSSFVFVGQKGLAPGKAIEKVAQVTEKDAEAMVSISGCLTIPMGPIDPQVSLNGRREEPPKGKPGAGPSVSRKEAVVYGQELPHCGLKDPCPAGQFAAAVYSGKHKDDEPKLCINGRFVVGRNLNKAGRGLNIVVLNATAKDVLRVGHFDTYLEDSSTLEIFLEQIVQGEMVILVTFDEASNRLSNMAKQIFYELGSGLVQNLKFRASWYFVGQKGISGFTPFEELNFASGNDWAKPVDLKLCIPFKLDGRKVRPDPSATVRNEKKRHFCSKYDGYEEFCDGSKIDDQLTPSPALNKSLQSHPIFKVPILIVAGLSHNSLRLCLETVLRQPGINPAMVLVTYDENYPESGDLAKLFGFKTEAINTSASYISEFSRSLEAVWWNFPDTSDVIVLEEELLLTGDFLMFMAQLLPILHKEEGVFSVSAWNENGFAKTSSLKDAVYRVEGFPGLGFMIRRATYDKFLAKKMTECCLVRVWEGWFKNSNLAPKMLVPDVSRVLRRHTDGLGVLDPKLEDLFHRERGYTNSREMVIPLKSPERLLGEEYERDLNASLKTAKVIGESSLAACVHTEGVEPPKLPLVDDQKQTFVVYVKQKSPQDYEVFYKLCQCFGLYHSENLPPKGLYKNLLRFSYDGRPMLFVGSSSPFYAFKPLAVTPMNR